MRRSSDERKPDRFFLSRQFILIKTEHHGILKKFITCKFFGIHILHVPHDKCQIQEIHLFMKFPAGDAPPFQKNEVLSFP